MTRAAALHLLCRALASGRKNDVRTAFKWPASLHFEVLRKLTEYERLQNTRVSLEAEIRRLNKIIDELNEAAIDAGDVP